MPGSGFWADGQVFGSLREKRLRVLRAVPAGRPSTN